MSETSHQVLCMYPTSHPCRACATSHLNTEIDYSLEHCHNSNHIPRTNYLLGLKGNFFFFSCIQVELKDFPGGTVCKNWLPVQGTHVQPLVRVDLTCHAATKPTPHND